jgi:hypothetical protein
MPALQPIAGDAFNFEPVGRTRVGTTEGVLATRAAAPTVVAWTHSEEAAINPLVERGHEHVPPRATARGRVVDLVEPGGPRADHLGLREKGQRVEPSVGVVGR